MSRLDRYYIPPGVPARPPAPPLPRKGILMMAPPPPPPSLPPPSIHHQQFYQPHQHVTVVQHPQPQHYQRPSILPPQQPKQQQPSSLQQPLNRMASSYNSPGVGVVTRDYEDLHRVQAMRPKHLDSSNVATAMALPDASPRLALQRIVTLYQNGEHKEAANFMRRLSFPTFRQILPQLPADIFIESMPHSLPILEALYAKLFTAGDTKILGKAQSLRPEAIIWQLVKFFANQEDGMSNAGQMRWEFCGPFISSCKRLLQVLLSAEPRLKRLVAERKRALMKAIEGLGQHGLVGTSDEQLMNLHNALKLEFEVAQKTYQEALSKLEQLELLAVGKNTNGKGTINGKSPAPVAQSHQRQLSLKANEVQERLIKNKSLLNVIEPTLENTSLEVLLGILQKRIELDKECLFQYTQIKKDMLMSGDFSGVSKNIQHEKANASGNSNNNNNSGTLVTKRPTTLVGGKAIDGQSVAPILMRYQRGCQQVLELMKELQDESAASVVTGSAHPYEDDLLNSNTNGEMDALSDDLSGGYHSDSESCVMTSGNSPFISKEARYNFLTRSVRYGSKHSIRASILASSLCLAETRSKAGSTIGGSSKPGSVINGGNGSNSCSNLKLLSTTFTGSNTKLSQMDSMTSESASQIMRQHRNNRHHHFSSQANSKQNSEVNNNGVHSSSGVSSGSTSSDISDDGNDGHSKNNGNKSDINGSVVSAASTVKRSSKAGSVVTASGSSGVVINGSTGRPPRTKPRSSVQNSKQLCYSCSNNLSDPIYQGIIERDISAIRKETEMAELKTEMEKMRQDLTMTRKSLFAAEDAENDLKNKLAEESKRSATLEKMIKANAGEEAIVAHPVARSRTKFGHCASTYVRRYGELYAQLRLETLDALDKLPELVNSDELKNKLLFSVVVLAFRSVNSTVENKREQIRRILQLPPPPKSSSDEIQDENENNLMKSFEVETKAISELEDAVASYLRRAAESFDLSKNVEEVCSQIWATLYDYPCLKSCDGIIIYVKECVRVAWGLVNQHPAYTVEYETREYRSDLHVRYHSARSDSDVISTYMWPALLEGGQEGPCVHKGVVVT